MITKLKNLFTNSSIKEDGGSFSQTLLFSMMVPGIIALVLSSALMQLSIQRAETVRTSMITAVEIASSYLLGDINTKLPMRYVTMSSENPGELAAETTRTVESVNADTHVTKFEVDENGWITATFSVQLNNQPDPPRSWTMKYRPTSATVFKGFDPSNGRPLWAFTDPATNPSASVEPLGLFEEVPLVASVDDYPTVNRPGVKAGAPQNLRIVQSEQFGLVLAWEKPLNASEAGLVGYRIDSTKNPDCVNLPPSNTGANVLADGYLKLHDDPNNKNVPSWTCSSSDTTNLVSVRGIGNKGVGASALINLSTLPQYDLDNLIPLTPTNLAYAKVGANHTLSWDEVTCKFGYTPQFRVHKIKNNNASGNFGIADWFSNAPSAGKHTYIIPAGTVNVGSTQEWTVDARCTNPDFGPSSATEKASPVASTTVPITTTPVINNVRIEGTTTGTALWDASVCPANTTAEYRVAFTKKNNVASTELIRNWTSGSTSVAVAANLGTYNAVKVDVRCGQANGGAPQYSPIASRTSADWLSGIPAPTGSWTYLANNGVTLMDSNDFTCAAGTPMYQLIKVSDSSIPSQNGLAYGWNTYSHGYLATYQGSQVQAKLQVKCAVGSESSTIITSATQLWNHPVTTRPNVQTAVSRWGVNYYSIVWGGYSGCPAGTNYWFTNQFVTASGSASYRFNYWGQVNGGVSPNFNHSGLMYNMTAIQYNTHTTCRNPTTNLYGPWATRWAYWGGNWTTGSGVPHW